MAATYVDSASIVANAAGTALSMPANLPCTPGDLLLAVVWYRDSIPPPLMNGNIQQALTVAGFSGVTLAQGAYTGASKCTFAYGYRWATGTEGWIWLQSPDPDPRRCGIVCVEVAGATLVGWDIADNDEATAAQIIPQTGAVTLADDGLVVSIVAAVPDNTALTAPAGWTLGALDTLASSPGGQCGAAYVAGVAGPVAAADFGGGGTQVGWRTVTWALASLETPGGTPPTLAVAEVTIATPGGLSTPSGRANYPQPPDDPLDPQTVAWPPDPATGPTVPAYPWGVTKEAD